MTPYPISDIYPSVQGEGVQSGVPMVVLRLQGCDVGCPFCDTRHTWTLRPVSKRDTLAEVLGPNTLWTEMEPAAIANFILQKYPAFKWVLVTGGEPALYDLAPLVQALHGIGVKAAIETSGTELGHVDAGFDWVCVSPKIGMPGGKVVHSQAVAVADEIKFVVGKQGDVDKISGFLNEWLGRLTKTSAPRKAQICLQPISQSNKATAIAVAAVQRNAWRLSIQTHKYINLP